MDSIKALNDFRKTREYIKQEYQSKYCKENIEVGDFSYGVPSVLDWGEGSKLHIGKFCSIAKNVTILLGGGASS